MGIENLLRSWQQANAERVEMWPEIFAANEGQSRAHNGEVDFS